MKKHYIGIAALVIGVVALGLAVIPGIALGKPMPWLDELRTPPPEPQGGFTVKFKGVSLTLGKKDEDETARTPAEEQADDRIIRYCTISAISCSLVGLILGPISWVKEKRPAFAGSAIGVSCLALVWQYVLIGIIIGVGIAAMLIVLSHFAG